MNVRALIQNSHSKFGYLAGFSQNTLDILLVNCWWLSPLKMPPCQSSVAKMLRDPRRRDYHYLKSVGKVPVLPISSTGPACLSPNFELWVRGAVAHRMDESGFQEGPAMTSLVSKDHKVQVWAKNGLLHRTSAGGTQEGPAYIETKPNLDVQMWAHDGIFHREGGPAIVVRKGFGQDTFLTTQIWSTWGESPETGDFVIQDQIGPKGAEYHYRRNHQVSTFEGTLSNGTRILSTYDWDSKKTQETIWRPGKPVQIRTHTQYIQAINAENCSWEDLWQNPRDPEHFFPLLQKAEGIRAYSRVWGALELDQEVKRLLKPFLWSAKNVDWDRKVLSFQSSQGHVLTLRLDPQRCLHSNIFQGNLPPAVVLKLKGKVVAKLYREHGMTPAEIVKANPATEIHMASLGKQDLAEELLKSM